MFICDLSILVILMFSTILAILVILS